jgi:hypothetical protein
MYLEILYALYALAVLTRNAANVLNYSHKKLFNSYSEFTPKGVPYMK